MVSWLRELDRILRGDATRLSALRAGAIPIAPVGVGAMVIVLGMVYGFFMGWFAVFNRVRPEYWQLLASTLKVPALFLLTLLVTWPSLYVFNALVGSRLSLASLVRLLIAALAVALAVLASFGTITAFFSLTTENYSFMVLLNVIMFAIAGTLGLTFLLRTLHRLTIADALSPPPVPPTGPSAGPAAGPDPGGAEPGGPEPAAGVTIGWSEGALDEVAGGHVLGRNVKTVFRCWVVIFALVGAQMSWVLRPFIGDPRLPFAWFRARESNFFEAVWHTIEALFR